MLARLFHIGLKTRWFTPLAYIGTRAGLRLPGVVAVFMAGLLAELVDSGDVMAALARRLGSAAHGRA
jgi:hypothetical protein